MPIGLLFPVGLITLGITLFVARPINRWIGALLAAAGVLFPIGRAVGIETAYVATDVLLAASFALIGWQLFTRPELCQADEARGEMRDFADASRDLHKHPLQELEIV